MRIASKTLEMIRKNQDLKNLLALENHCSGSTINRWLLDAKKQSGDKGIMLTTAANLKIIREQTGLSDEQILTEAEKSAS